MSWFWAPSSTRATSRTRSSEPSGLARNTILPNCSGVVRRPCVCTFNWNCWSSADRACADPADRRLHVLRLDRRDDIGRGQLQIVRRWVSNQMRIE